MVTLFGTSIYPLEFLYFFVTFFFLILFFYFVYTQKEKKVSLKKYLCVSFIFGYTFTLFSWSWLYSVYPIEWFPKGGLQLFALFFLHQCISIIGGISFLCVGITLWYTTTHVYNSFLKTCREYIQIFFIPISFAVAEIVRSLLISLIFLGKESSITLHWSQANIGNALSFIPLVELAYIGGTFVLTWAFVASIYPFFVVRKKVLPWHYAFSLLPWFLTLGIHVYAPISGPTQKVATLIVGTSFEGNVTSGSTTSEWLRRKNNIDTTLQSFVDSNPSLIVLPEDARYISLTTKKEQELFRFHFPNTILVDGGTLPSVSGLKNYSLFYDAKQDVTLGRGKLFLFPFYEYMPFLFKQILYAFLGEEALQTYQKNHTYTQGTKMFTYQTSFGKIGTLLCSEAISYASVAQLHKEKPDIVILQSYLSSFRNNHYFYMHYFSYARIIAAQVRAPLVVVAQDAPNMLITPQGKILSVFEAKKGEVTGKVLYVDKKPK